MKKVLAITRVSAKMAKVGVKKALIVPGLCQSSTDIMIWNLFIWNVESHSSVAAWGELIPTLKGLAVLTMPPTYGEKNAMCMALNENVTEKLEYLNFALTVSKSSIKQHMLRGFPSLTKERGAIIGWRWTPCYLTGSSGLYYPVDRKMV